MRHWATQGEPHSLNSGLGRLPGGGVRNQSSGCEGGILYPFPTSQLHNPLGLLPRTAGACWNRLFWRLVVVGRTLGLLKAAVLRFWGVTGAQHPLLLLHSPPRTPSPTASRVHVLPTGNLSDCCLQGNLSSSFSVVFLFFATVRVQLFLSPLLVPLSATL